MAEILHNGNLYHLRNDVISYVLMEMPGGVLSHLYFGARLEGLNAANLLRHANIPADGGFSVQECTLDRLPQEYPSFGLGDLRDGALTVEGPDGSWAVDLRVEKVETPDAKPRLAGLPATRGEDCAALRVTLRDAHTGLIALLDYAIYDDCPAVTRSVKLVNGGAEPLNLTRAYSLCLDLPDDGWDIITLPGAWARERAVCRRPLAAGHQGISSRRGASSAQASPFMALARPEANQAQGEVIGATLIYSGNFMASAEVSQFGVTRVLLGIDERDFGWQLLPGEDFQAPEAALVYSDEGIGGMSRGFHALWENHLLPVRWMNRKRPVLLNSWEAAYFDFNHDKLLAIAKAAADAGVELFVMDDGWFGHRDDDHTSLGDWNVDRRKLPQGLEGLGQAVRALGIYGTPGGSGLRGGGRVRYPEGQRGQLPEMGHEPQLHQHWLRGAACRPAKGDGPPLHAGPVRGDGAAGGGIPGGAVRGLRLGRRAL